MSNLYGYLHGDRGEATKSSSQRISSKVQTWNGSVSVHLNRDGDYDVEVGPGPSGGPSTHGIAHGNLHSTGGEHRRRPHRVASSRPSWTGRPR